MQIKQQITISTSADKVWEILGHQYDRYRLQTRNLLPFTVTSERRLMT